MILNELFEQSRKYTGVIEPHSRPAWGQEITINRPMIVYHVTHEGENHILADREQIPIRDYNSIGTWFSSNRELVLKLFGQYVSSYKLPTGKYLLAKRKQTMWDLMLNYLPIIEKWIGREAAEHLRLYPIDETAIQFMKSIKIAARAFAEVDHGFATDSDIRNYLSYSPQGRTEKSRYDALEKSLRHYKDVCLNKNYAIDFRNLLIGSGIQGIIWNNRFWDTVEDRQTVFLVFKHATLVPEV